MDQDEFRRLLVENKFSSRTQTSFAPIPRPSRRKVPETAASSSPGFQPRKLDKKGEHSSAYRDRAAERRAGLGHDPIGSTVENVDSKDVDSKNDNIEEGRTEEPPPVKGLDIAQVEQSRLHINTTEEDDYLETAFQETRTKSDAKSEVLDGKGAGQKRTRDDLIRALKEQRTRSDAPKDLSSDSAFEKAKQLGKFKPIGAQDIPPKAGSKHRREDGVAEVHPKKKKKKSTSQVSGNKNVELQSETQEKEIARKENKVDLLGVPSKPSPPLDIDEDIDIFAGVGDYDGVDLNDEEGDDDANKKEDDDVNEDAPVVNIPQNRWFDGDEATSITSQPLPAGNSSVQPPTPSPPPEEGVSGSDPTALTRLQALSSSSMPSIRDFLDVEKITNAYEKRQAKKKAKKAGKEKVKGDQEGKVDRDYQKLNSYMKNKAS